MSRAPTSRSFPAIGREGAGGALMRPCTSIVAQNALGAALPRLNSPLGPRPLSPGANRPTRLGRMAGFDVGDGTCADGQP